ncbi:MAG: lytic transglycosylase protein [Panacagrimonas sp.]|jgi:soluble lytic murein transglycosylase-like protein|nr:lytic transglycosylase domain-containing protein [Panacagrimonas sp.]MCC2657756.1 lytic transglycosylase protein [Panacagrimonas sp.]
MTAVLCGALASAGPVSASDREIHVYRQADGTRLYTDRKQRSPGVKYVGTFGRPTAYKSCNRMTPALLKTRGDGYLPLIRPHAQAHGVPAELVRAVMQVESCFDKKAVSRVGARGLMQLMPGTAADLGVQNSFDPAQNIAGGVRYLGMMRKRYPSDWKLALAAYNAGPGAVDKYRGIPPFAETQSYVKRVMSLYEKAIRVTPATTATAASASMKTATVAANTP